MPIQTINHLPYHYQTSGTGQPLLLLHGFTGCSTNWHAQTAVFSQQYQVLAIDILGHGQTAVPANPNRYQMSHVAADIVELVQTAVSPPYHLLGYSMGGRLALYLALHYPHLFRSLTLESSSPGLATAAARDARRASDNALADRIERDGIPAFVDFWERIPLFASQKQLQTAVRARLRQQRLRNNPLGLANSLRGMGTGQQPSLWGLLPQLNLPTLLLAGALDPKYVALNQQMAAQLPNVQLTILPNAGHTIHLEQPLQFNQLVLDFLAAYLHPSNA